MTKKNVHEIKLAEDMAIIDQMIQLVENLLQIDDEKEIRRMLIELGELARTIQHDKDDPQCIRNKYGMYSDEKGKTREQRYNPYGIPFQGLNYLSKWLETEDNKVSAGNLKSWITQNEAEFKLLRDKLKALPLGEISKIELVNLQQVCEYANDNLHLAIVINALEAVNFDTLNLEDEKSRFALARIYALLGEAAKCLSGTISHHENLKNLFTKLGQLRDLVKLPFMMPKTKERMQPAYEFIKNFSNELLAFFKNIQEDIFGKFKLYQFLYLKNYRVSLEGHLFILLEDFQVNKIYEALKDIKLKQAEIKKLERAAYEEAKKQPEENEIDDELELEVEHNKIDELEIVFAEAVKLIKDYQNVIEAIEKLETDFLNLFGQKAQDMPLEALDAFAKRKKEKGQRWKDKIENELPIARQRLMTKYNERLKTLEEVATNLPKPDHDVLMATDVMQFDVKEKPKSKKAKMPKAKCLARDVSAVENIYKLLSELQVVESTIDQFAQDQCVAFLGQLFLNIEANHKLILEEPTSSVWNEDFGGTIKIRHARLMHNLVNYDANIVGQFVQHAIMPWRKNFSYFYLLTQYNQFASNIEIEALEKEKPTILTSLYNRLGLAYCQLNQFKKAQRYFLLGYEISQTSEDASLACLMHNLAEVYRDQKDWKNALHWMSLAWDHREKYLKETDRYYISTRVNLGLCYAQVGQLDAALECYTHGYDMAKRNNSDLSQVLNCLANFHADQMDYPMALKYYDELLQICETNVTRLYALSSLVGTAMECGQFEKALEYYKQKKTLFLENQGEFKSKLGLVFIEMKEGMIGPVGILDLMGRDEEALAILEKASVLSAYNQLLKLRLLRNVGRYTEAEKFARQMLNEDKEDKIKNEYILFTCKIIYGDVLIHLGHIEQGVKLLKQLCVDASYLRKRLGAPITHVVLGPFNMLVNQLMRERKWFEAKAYMQSAMAFIADIKLSGISNEIFIMLVNFYKAHLLANDKATLKLQMPVYEKYMVEHLKQTHPEKVWESMAELIRLLMQYHEFEVAEHYLSAILSNKTKLSEAHLEKFIELRVILAEFQILYGKEDKGIAMLFAELDEPYPETKKAEISFSLAITLMQTNRIPQLCDLVYSYENSWDKDFTLEEFELYQQLKIMSNLYFFCAMYCAENNAFDKATYFSKRCLQLSPRIYNALLQANPVELQEFSFELFRQYWRMPMALAEFTKVDYTSLFKFYLVQINIKDPLVLASDLARNINAICFGNDLVLRLSVTDRSLVMLEIPAHWRKFLSDFHAYIPTIISSGKPTELTFLNMNPQDFRITEQHLETLMTPEEVSFEFKVPYEEQMRQRSIKRAKARFDAFINKAKDDGYSSLSYGYVHQEIIADGNCVLNVVAMGLLYHKQKGIDLFTNNDSFRKSFADVVGIDLSTFDQTAFSLLVDVLVSPHLNLDNPLIKLILNKFKKVGKVEYGLERNQLANRLNLLRHHHVIYEEAYENGIIKPNYIENGIRCLAERGELFQLVMALALRHFCVLHNDKAFDHVCIDSQGNEIATEFTLNMADYFGQYLGGTELSFLSKAFNLKIKEQLGEFRGFQTYGNSSNEIIVTVISPGKVDSHYELLLPRKTTFLNNNLAMIPRFSHQLTFFRQCSPEFIFDHKHEDEVIQRVHDESLGLVAF